MAAPANPELSALYPTERPWSRRRLYGFIAVCLVVQLLIILVFGERRVRPLRPAAFSTGIHLVADAWFMEQLAAFSEISDPSVFALPSLQGFSRAGWLTYKAPPDEFANEPQPAKWLELDSRSLGRDLSAFLATNTAAPLRIGDEPMPNLVGLQPRPSAELTFPRSELRMAGALAGRKLLTSPDLPSWPSTSVLTNSVVRLLVDPDGAPFSAALVSGSGLKDADNYALATAKRLRFKPDRAGASVTSGTANFAWHTLPAATNRILSPGLAPP